MTESNQQLNGLEIAVTGMAVRFPGASDIRAFWGNLRGGVESISFFTPEELADAAVPEASLQDPNYVNARGVVDRIEFFDPGVFDYTPAEATVLDPQLRLFHECCWEALEDAGVNPASYKGKIGLFAGASNNFYWQALAYMAASTHVLDAFSIYQLVNKDAVAALVSFKLNLRGPGYSVNTACSTSLVTVHLACQALLSGECRLALAGGATVMLPQKQGYIYKEGMVSSPDGHCRAFDIDARGTVGGDGAGVVLLKMYEEARDDGDHVYAVIKGSATNNDGSRKSGYTAPSIQGQVAVIQAAQAFAEVEPDTIGYIEAHGTGTPIGDPIEIEALKRAFAVERKNVCAVGSVKTNLGHLDAAAGIAGLIKTILALYHKEIPPSLHYREPNPKLEIQDSPFFIADSLRPWPAGRNPRRAGVSSFGVGGTNAHIVLEEAPLVPPDTCSPSRPYQLLLLSANTEYSLQRKTEELALHLANEPGINLADAAYTLQVGRKEFPLRRMAVCGTIEEAVDPNIFSRTHRSFRQQPPLIFIFTGIGSQYTNMGRDLYHHERSFRRYMDECFDAYARLTGKNLIETLYPVEEANRRLESGLIDEFDLAQPLLFMVQYSLARLLIEWGLSPDSMIGYSFGEITAACVAGVLSMEDALRLLSVRGAAAKKIAGGMLSVPLPADEVRLYPGNELYLAIDNGATSVVAGPVAELEELETRLKRDKLFCVRVQNPCPMHSPLMRPAGEEMMTSIAGLTFNPPKIPYISNVTGMWMTNEDARDPSYWARHLSGMARFDEGMRRVFDDPAAILVEIGPGRDLSSMLGRFMESKGSSPRQIVNMLRPAHQNEPDLKYLLQKIGRLWLHGVAIDWEVFHSGKKRRRIPLPTYPFDRRRYWIDGNPFQGTTADSSPNVRVSMAEPTSRSNSADDEPIDTGFQYAEAQNHIQRQLLGIWRRFFGIGTIGIRDDFFELGGDSLKAMNAAALIEREMGIEVPVAEFYNRHTIENLSLFVAEAKTAGSFLRLQPAEEKDYYPLSSAQRRLFALQQMTEGNTGYNEPIAVKITGELNLQRAEQVFWDLIRRHEVLRTQFILLDGEPVQRIIEAGALDFAIEHARLTPAKREAKDLIASFIRPFDLSRTPILRVRVLQEESDRYILLVDTHHIISDGTTQTILMKEFVALYSGASLTPLPLQYKDFAQWQQRLFDASELQKQQEYWLGIFSQLPPDMELPYDRPRPAILSFKGSVERFSLEASVGRRLKELAAKGEASLFMALLAVFYVLLARLSGEEDIVVGSPIAGRRFAQLQPLMGMFVNTLAHRNRPEGGKQFSAFLSEVRRNAIVAFDNQDYQFENLVERVAATRDSGRNPLFDVMMTLQNIQLPEMELPGLKIEPILNDTGTAKFDLTLLAFEREDAIDFSMEFNIALFDRATIRRFIDYFTRVIGQVTKDPELPLGKIEVLSPGEKLQILDSLSGATTTCERESTIVDDWLWQTVQGPDGIAFILPESPGRSESRIAGGNHQVTYRFCDQSAVRLACELQEMGAGPERIIAILAEPSLEVMIGILAILRCNCAFLPIDRDYPPERIEYMLDDSGSVLILASDRDRKLIPAGFRACFFERAGRQTIELREALDMPLPEDPAYSIYTSGSTGKPKGVMISHHNLANFYRWHNATYEVTNRDRGAKYAGFSFDASILEIFPFLAAGASIYFISKEDRLDLESMNRLFHVHCVTMAYLPTALCRQFMELENRSLRLLHTGGEKLSGYVPGDYPLVDNYGPSECTVITSSHLLDSEHTRLSLGVPVHNTTVCILDRHDRLQPPGVPGELCVAGACVGMGYLNRPELMARSFFVHPLLPGKRLYRTGDIARFTADGFLEFLGRKDNQVKIRGFRIELGEIENLLQAHPAVQTGVVAALRHNDGSNYLCAYVHPASELDVNGLKLHLSSKLPDYMIPSYFVELDSLPLNQSGKLDRSQLPRPDLKLMDGTDFAPAENDIQAELCRIWEEILGLPAVGIRQNFFTIGGDSIKAIKLMSRINRRFSSRLKVTDLYHFETVETLSLRVREDSSRAEAYDFSSIEEDILRMKRRIMGALDPEYAKRIEDIYPMADIQKGMVFHSLKDRSISAYHNQFPVIVVFDKFKPEVFSAAVKLMMAKHGILRTAFAVDDLDEPVQLLFKEVEPDIQSQDISTLDWDSQHRRIAAFMENDRQNPFQLDRPPLFRLRLFHLGDQKVCILLILHHAILDGWSNASLMTELNNTYRRLKSDPSFAPARLTTSYRDYVLHEMAEKRNTEAREFWVRELLDYKRLALPRREAVDRGEPAMAMIKVPLGKILTEGLTRAATRYNTSIKNLCLAAYMFMLKMIVFENDLTVGLVGHTRPMTEDGDKLLGCFLNTVPFRLQIPPRITWQEFAGMVSQKTLAVKDHDNVPFFEIVKLAGEKSRRENPVFDTIFNFIDFHILRQAEFDRHATETSNDDSRGIREYGYTNTLIDLSVNAFGDDIGLSLNIHRDVLDEEQGMRLCCYFKRALELMIGQPRKIVSQADVMSEDELLQLKSWSRGAEFELPKAASVVELIDRARNDFPDRVAVVFQRPEEGDNHHISYDVFWRQAGCLADILRQKGIGKNDLVAVMMERSPQLPIAIIGVLRAGAAYVPIDPAYPQSRIRYMIEDSDLRFAVSQTGISASLDEAIAPIPAGNVVVLDNDPLSETMRPTEPLFPEAHDPAYIIYTSGSTGKPKGVAVEHASVVNLAASQAHEFGIDENERILQFSTVCFDASVEQLFLAFSSGAALVLVSRDDILDHARFGEYALRQQITHVHAVPSYLNHIDPQPLRGLKRGIAGGDVCSPQLAGTWSRRATFYNEYGPTETTVTSIQLKIQSMTGDWQQCPIGAPIGNTIIHVFDRNMQPVPPGVEGELYIGGKGVARGYLNRPQLTAERFVDDPDHPGQRLYRTGDLVRYLEDGNLQFRGRLDLQVKIRGFRIELGEIENQLLKLEGIEDAVVTARTDDSGEQYLAAYVVPAGDGTDLFDRQKVKNLLSRQLPDYMIPAYIAALEAIPHTPGGKVDAGALPSPVPAAPAEGVDFLAPLDRVEETLIQAARKVLGQPVISMGDNFFDLGGDSIKAIQLSAALRKHRMKLEVKDLFLDPVFASLAARVKPLDRLIPQGAVSGSGILTPVQRALFEHSNLHSHYFNQAVMLFRQEGFEASLVREAFARIVDHHDALRMVFPLDGNVPSPFNRPPGDGIFEIEVFDFKYEQSPQQSIRSRAEEIQGELDIGIGPLVKLALFQTRTGEHLLIVIHHLVVDGISWRILLEDLSTLLIQLPLGREVNLPPKTDSFLEWSRRLNGYAVSPELLDEIPYWRRVLSRESRLLESSRSAKGELKKGIHAEAVSGDLLSPGETMDLLGGVHRAYNTDVNDILLAALALALSLWTGRTRHVVTLEGHGREEIIEDIDITRTVGWFTTQFPIVLEAPDDQDVAVAIKRTKEMLRSVPNKGIGFGVLKYVTPPEKKFDAVLGEEPDICFNFLGQFGQTSGEDEPAFEFSPLPVGPTVDPGAPMRFCLDINGMVVNRMLSMTFGYNRNEYSQAEIQALFDCYSIQLQQILKHCMQREEVERTVSDFTMSGLDEEELESVYDALDEALYG